MSKVRNLRLWRLSIFWRKSFKSLKPVICHSGPDLKIPEGHIHL